MNPEKLINESPSLDSDGLHNIYGSVRRGLVHSKYKNGDISLNDVMDLYVEWRDDPEYFILRGITENNTMQERLFQNNTGYGDTWYLDPDLCYLYKFIKASKRGNDVYKHLVEKRLSPIDKLHDIVFFNDDTVDKRTSILFITLSYDTKRCSIDQAWDNIGKEFHLFHNNLRKQYGRVEIFRTWESTNHKYPHVHLIAIFDEFSFPVLTHKDKDGNISYRIPYKQKEKLGKYWHSNIDVQAIDSSYSAIKELTKYITKDLCSEKGDTTNSMIWLFRKQGYSVSKGFKESIKGWFIDFNEPTNCDLINDMCNCNHDIIKWEFLGILRGVHLGFTSDLWCVDLKKPPPRVVEMIIKENIRWRLLHWS